MATDLEGSTRHWNDRPEEMALASAAHDQLVRDIYSKHGGESVGRLWEGDSTFATFPSAAPAIAAGLEIQLAVSELKVGSIPLRVRVAVHSADCDATGTFPGAELNRTLKMRSVAHGGQMILSSASVVEAGSALPPDTAVEDLGWHRLAFGSDRVRLFQLVHPCIERTFPSLNTIESSPNNIGYHLTTFIGRTAELARVSSLLADPGAVAICGMPGIGKSRLAREAASEMLAAVSDGVWLVDAHGVETVDGFWEEVDRLVPGSGDPRDADAVIVVDGESAVSMADIAAQAGRPRLVFTGCFPDLQTERLIRLGPLDLSEDEIPDAVCLFIDRASERQPETDLTRSIPVITEICRSVGGHPLAIEMLAARITTMDPSSILGKLGQRPLLWGASRHAGRPSALKARFDEVFALLDPTERGFIERLHDGDRAAPVPDRLLASDLVTHDPEDGSAALPVLVGSYLDFVRQDEAAV